jgi:ketosteroid isomerase-like protein
MPSSRDIVETFLNRWADDPAGAMRMVAPDIIYTLNVSADAHPLGGKTVGWDAVNAMMLGIRNDFDYLVYKPRILSVEGDTVRARIELLFCHKASGELLPSQMRTVLTVRDGLIARVDEYVDAPMLEAFMRLFSSGKGAENR